MPGTARPPSGQRLSPIDSKSSSSAQASTSASHDNENLKSADYYTHQSSILGLSSPKTSAKSRLAPLEITSERRKATTNGSSTNERNKSAGSASSNDYQDAASTGNDRNANSASSTTSRDRDNPEELESWKNYIEPLLNLMNGYFRESQVDLFCDACDRLNKLLDTHKMFSKTCSKRAVILKIIFKYLDTQSDKMKIKITRIILNVKNLFLFAIFTSPYLFYFKIMYLFLKMKVSGNNLTNICRLLFSVSRNTDNDIYFEDNDIQGY